MSNFQTLLDRRTPGHALEQGFYTDAAVFQADLEALFYREWLFAIAACELARPGDYVTHQVGDYRVILLRDGQGDIRAFHNSCRHRGAILCKAQKGHTPKLVCPCHQWTYELDGSLFRARDTGPDFVPGDHGLKPVHCREVAGLVYICLAQDAPDFDAFAGRITP